MMSVLLSPGISVLLSPGIEAFLGELLCCGPIAVYEPAFRAVLEGLDREADRNPLACARLIKLEQFLGLEVPLPRRICDAAGIALDM
jgi:hypothetical protein